MTDLRFTGKTPDGVHITLADNDGNEFTLRISDSLRASVNQQRLSSVPDESEQILSVKDIQRRLRLGESAQDIARDSGTSIEKIERFAGPILQERSFIIDQAHAIIVRRNPGEEPESLFEVVLGRLAPRDISEEDLAWNAWRHHDGTWSLSLSYPNSDGHGDAIWEFDPTRRSITSQDENARWMMGDAPGIAKIAEFKMADIIRKTTVEKGLDPRDFTVFAFGGAGPVHAGVFARDRPVGSGALAGLSDLWASRWPKRPS